MNQLKIGTREEFKEHKGLSRQIQDYKHIHHKFPGDEKLSEWIAKSHLKENKRYYIK